MGGGDGVQLAHAVRVGCNNGWARDRRGLSRPRVAGSPVLRPSVDCTKEQRRLPVPVVRLDPRGPPTDRFSYDPAEQQARTRALTGPRQLDHNAYRPQWVLSQPCMGRIFKSLRRIPTNDEQAKCQMQACIGKLR
eukprot:6195779-Pleurochrysis_carterae.AAC.3